jgi:antagonist of KipI
MDEVSHRLANLLLGNPAQAPTLEMTLTGPSLRFETEAMIALCGADFSPSIENLPVPLWRPVLVRAGSQLRFGRAGQGARCYLAVEGGFSVPSRLGSASTHLAAGFGGFQGRSLKIGDRLETGPCAGDRYPALRRRLQQGQRPFLGTDWFAPWVRELDFHRPAVLRIIPGPQWSLLTEESRRGLLETTFKVASNSDRMGIRMQGPKLSLDHPLEMISSGVATGTLQLPPDGSLILLMADRQTTGGYPRLGEVASVDLPGAAQLRPGDALRFIPVSIEEAQALLLSREARLRDLEQILADQQTR